MALTLQESTRTPLLTREEIRQLFRVNERTIDCWLEAGKIEIIGSIRSQPPYRMALSRILAVRDPELQDKLAPRLREADRKTGRLTIDLLPQRARLELLQQMLRPVTVRTIEKTIRTSKSYLRPRIPRSSPGRRPIKRSRPRPPLRAEARKRRRIAGPETQRRRKMIQKQPTQQLTHRAGRRVTRAGQISQELLEQTVAMQFPPLKKRRRRRSRPVEKPEAEPTLDALQTMAEASDQPEVAEALWGDELLSLVRNTATAMDEEANRLVQGDSGEVPEVEAEVGGLLPPTSPDRLPMEMAWLEDGLGPDADESGARADEMEALTGDLGPTSEPGLMEGLAQLEGEEEGTGILEGLEELEELELLEAPAESESAEEPELIGEDENQEFSEEGSHPEMDEIDEVVGEAADEVVDEVMEEEAEELTEELAEEEGAEPEDLELEPVSESSHDEEEEETEAPEELPPESQEGEMVPDWEATEEELVSEEERSLLVEGQKINSEKHWAGTAPEIEVKLSDITRTLIEIKAGQTQVQDRGQEQTVLNSLEEIKAKVDISKARRDILAASLTAISDDVRELRLQLSVSNKATMASAKSVQNISELVARQTSTQAASKPALQDPSNRTTLALGLGILIMTWSLLFYFKTGEAYLALGGLVIANIAGCATLLLCFRGEE